MRNIRKERGGWAEASRPRHHICLHRNGPRADFGRLLSSPDASMHGERKKPKITTRETCTTRSPHQYRRFQSKFPPTYFITLRSSELHESPASSNSKPGIVPSNRSSFPQSPRVFQAFLSGRLCRGFRTLQIDDDSVSAMSHNLRLACASGELPARQLLRVHSRSCRVIGIFGAVRGQESSH